MDLSKKTAVIVCHDAMFGPPQELRDYLLSRSIGQLLFIGHPNRAMHDNHIKASYFRYYRKGKLVAQYEMPVWDLQEHIGYVKDFFLTLFWSIWKIKGQTDYFIGLGNLNAFSGLCLRALGLTKAVYYYVIDYIPNRFKNSSINELYHGIEMMSALYSDRTWNYAQAMIAEREKKWKRRFPHQMVVPNGIHLRSSIISPFEKIHKHELIYLGTLSEQQGVQMVIEALPLVKKEIRDIHLTLIGKGSYRPKLEHLIKKLRLSAQVTFLGFIEDPVEVDKRISLGALGMAVYDPKLTFVVYTEPGKVKRYLSAGVPVLMTNISPLATMVKEKSCGFVCTWDKEDVAKKIISFFHDETRMKQYRKNAVSYVRKFTWDRIFTDAFTKSTMNI